MIMNKIILFALVLYCLPLAAQQPADYRIGTSTVSIDPDTTIFSLALSGYGAPRDGRFSLEWKYTGPATEAWLAGVPPEINDPEVLSTARYGNRIYALHKDNTLWYAKEGASPLKWLKIARHNGFTYNIQVKQILVRNGRLYAVDADNKLYIATHSTTGDLSATALAVQHKGKTVVIVGVDLVGFDYTLGRDVKRIIQQKRKIPPSAILINASHTHYAPVTQKFPCWGPFGQAPDSAYLNDRLKKQMVKAIESALDHMEPAGLYFGRSTTNIGHNRCSENKETPYDQTLDVLKTVNAGGNTESILFLTGCHPVFRNEGRESFTITGNFPSVTRQLLQNSQHVPHTMFLQGCAGDINPRDDDHHKTADTLAHDVTGILQNNMQHITGGISYSFDSVLVPVTPWDANRIQQFRKENDGHEGDVYAEKNVRWADLMLGYYHNNRMPAAMPIYIQVIDIGNWRLVGLSREVVTEYGPAIRALWPNKTVSVAGYCNDVSSYLPAPWHVSNRTYEGYDSFFWYGQASTFPGNVLDIVVGKVRSLK